MLLLVNEGGDMGRLPRIKSRRFGRWRFSTSSFKIYFLLTVQTLLSLHLSSFIFATASLATVLTFSNPISAQRAIQIWILDGALYSCCIPLDPNVVMLAKATVGSGLNKFLSASLASQWLYFATVWRLVRVLESRLAIRSSTESGGVGRGCW